jgi:anti-sigma factor RsiW
MSHPHDALLQAHLDGELEPREMREVTRHLSACGACREASSELAAVGRSLSEAIATLDHGEPPEWSEAGAAPLSFPSSPAMRALDDDIAAPEPTTRTAPGPRRVHTLAAWRWAAAALLTVTGVAAAAVVRGAFVQPSPDASANATAAATAVSPPAAPQPAGAIAIAPRGGGADVTLTGAAPGSRLHIVVTKGADLTVHVSASSTVVEPARFRASESRIAVQLPHSAALVDMEIPAALHSVRVLDGDAVLATVEDGRVTPAAAATDGIVVGSQP